MQKESVHLSNEKSDFFLNIAFYMRPCFSSLSFSTLFLSTPSFFFHRPLFPLSFFLSAHEVPSHLCREARERVYRSIAERPRSHLLLLLKVRSRRAGFSLLLPRNFLSFFRATRCGATQRDATRLSADSIPPPRHPVSLSLSRSSTRTRVSLTSSFCRASKTTRDIAKSVDYLFFFTTRSIDRAINPPLLILINGIPINAKSKISFSGKDFLLELSISNSEIRNLYK